MAIVIIVVIAIAAVIYLSRPVKTTRRYADYANTGRLDQIIEELEHLRTLWEMENMMGAPANTRERRLIRERRAILQNELENYRIR